MQKRMNKKELINLLESLKIDREEFWVISSGALVLRGIIKDAGDLDLAVTERGLEELSKNYKLRKNGNGWEIENYRIECFLDIKEDWKIEKYLTYQLEDIKKYYKYLLESERDKDKLRIPLVEEYINNHK